MSETIEPGTALAILPRAALPVILAADDSNIFGKLYDELKSFVPDISTKRGRDEIASKARKVSVAKMDLKRLADALKEDALKTQRSINAEVRVLEEKMDALRDKVRAPLTEFEEAEAARIKANEDAIAALEALADGLAELSADDIKARWTGMETFDWSPEFRARGMRVAGGAVAQLQVAHQNALKREADAAAEAERLRVEAEETAAREAEEAEQRRLAAIEEQRLREERIAAEAAERAKVAAEEKAAHDAKEAEERAQAALREAEAKRQREAAEAAERERKAAAALAQAERDRQEAADRAEAARVAAEQKAERERLAAVEAERKRVADAEAARKAEEERRAADRIHRGRINREVLAGFVAAGMDEVIGRIAVEALAKGAIPHAAIRY